MIAGAFIIYLEEIEREDMREHYRLLQMPLEEVIKIVQVRHDKFMDELFKEVESL